MVVFVMRQYQALPADSTQGQREGSLATLAAEDENLATAMLEAGEALEAFEGAALARLEPAESPNRR
jgi:hypothetical protein